MKILLPIVSPRKIDQVPAGGQPQKTHLIKTTLTAAALFATLSPSLSFAHSPELFESLSSSETLEMIQVSGQGLEQNIGLPKSEFTNSYGKNRGSHSGFIQDSLLPSMKSNCFMDSSLKAKAEKEGKQYLGCSFVGTYGEGHIPMVLAVTTDNDKENQTLKPKWSKLSVRDFIATKVFGKNPESYHLNLHISEGVAQKVHSQFPYTQAAEVLSFAVSTIHQPEFTNWEEASEVLKKNPTVKSWASQGESSFIKKMKLVHEIGGIPGLKSTPNDQVFSSLYSSARLMATSWSGAPSPSKMLEAVTKSKAYTDIAPLLDHTCDKSPHEWSTLEQQSRYCLMNAQVEPNLKTLSSVDVYERHENGVLVGTFKGVPVVMTNDRLSSHGGAYVPHLQLTAPEGQGSQKALDHMDRDNMLGQTIIVMSTESGDILPAHLKTPETLKLFNHFVLQHELGHVLQSQKVRQTLKNGSGLLEASGDSPSVEGHADEYAIEAMVSSGLYDEHELSLLKRITDVTLSYYELSHQSNTGSLGLDSSRGLSRSSIRNETWKSTEGAKPIPSQKIKGPSM